MMMAQKNEIQETARIDVLFEKVSALINQARKHVATTINVAEVYTKYHIGQYIVEDEQQGKARAEYGKQVLKTLSNRLSARFGNGWSEETLKLCRRFFMVYSNSVNSDYPIQKEIGKQRLSNSSAVLTNIYATQYQLYLPDKDLLQAKVREWIAEFKETNGETE